MRADDAQGTPTQSHISPSILVYEDYTHAGRAFPARSQHCSRTGREWATYGVSGPLRAVHLSRHKWPLSRAERKELC